MAQDQAAETYPKSVDAIMAQTALPAVAANQEGVITFINKAFTATYGWTEDDIVGRSLTSIMPAKFREPHQFGFSRFLATEKVTLAGRPLALEILFKDGTVKNAEHFILADKQDGRWRFAATIVLR